MKFIGVIKSIKADISKKEISISFVVDMNEENLAEAEELSQFTGKAASDVEVDITSRQIAMFKTKLTAKS